MKYCEIEMFIDKEIEKAVAEIEEKHAHAKLYRGKGVSGYGN